MTSTMTRRSFIGSAAALLCASGIAGCGGAPASNASTSSGSADGGASGSESPDATAGDGATTWTATQDDSLNCLTMQVAGGNVVAMPGDGWAARDGYIQLQLSGGSVPGQRIASVQQEGGVLAVALEASGDASTLDLVLTEYRLESNQATVDAVETVKVDYGNGDVQEIQKAYE